MKVEQDGFEFEVEYEYTEHELATRFQPAQPEELIIYDVRLVSPQPSQCPRDVRIGGDNILELIAPAILEKLEQQVLEECRDRDVEVDDFDDTDYHEEAILRATCSH